MRYADAPTTSVTIEIDADVDAVWARVIDVDLPARFSPELERAEWTGDVIGLGATFTGHNVRGESSWTTTNHVVAYEPHRTFGWAVENVANPSAVWTFDLVAHEAGTTLTFTAQMGPGPSGLSAIIDRHPEREAEFIERRLAEHAGNMVEVLEGIKALVESS